MPAASLRQKINRRQVRHRRVRQKIFGTAERPRLCVFKSSEHFWAQVIDDQAKKTLVSATDISQGVRQMVKGTKREIAKILGKYLAGLAKEKGITRVVFDRGGFRYQGRIQQFAEGAREGGLIF
jgi:large subunit ribosomal protein L18